MGPEHKIPFPPAFRSEQEYTDALLEFLTSNSLLRLLCGGVHILDFFTTEPALYDRIFPEDWRQFFSNHEIRDLLDLFFREDLDMTHKESWRGGDAPPASLVEYLSSVRKHLLLRVPSMGQCARNRAMKPTQKVASHIAVGMNMKKVHEVGLFAHFLDCLVEDVNRSDERRVTHLVDFGSGQNYLGRALASEPYNRRIVAIESKSHNTNRAKAFDVQAGLAAKEKTIRNKKLFRAGKANNDEVEPLVAAADLSRWQGAAPSADVDTSRAEPVEDQGRIQYVEHRIQDGNLAEVVEAMGQPNSNLLVMSLHSCGNLVHHGLRSLVLNPAVKAVAMIGCCYNLVTERLGPATFKLPELRPTTFAHSRLHRLGHERDPHGFPMSRRLCSQVDADGHETGVRLNITARMMAVQAPFNWGERDSDNFFTRHFFRALLQRIFLDRGIVRAPSTADVDASSQSGGTPIIIGSLRKACYTSFVRYVRGALEKLGADSQTGGPFRLMMAELTDAEIEDYESRYAARKKELSVTWSLMALSAGIVEAVIVVDRWLWLTEQDEVKHAWVEPVFDYAFSPRNLVIVGIKK